jgi:hypothetical protein
VDETDRLIPHIPRLAALLGDERGAEILAELQKISLRGRRSPRSKCQESLSSGARNIGVWDIVDTADGRALRRQNRAPGELRMWADVSEVPGKGKARRVVLVGESSARGFLLDPAMTPSEALASRLEQWAGPGAYQCVDLAHTGASLEDVTELLAEIPQIDPDVLVLYVGNNWSVPQYSVADLDALSRELRSGGYAAMRRAFWPTVVLPRARLLLVRIQEILSRHVDVVVVIPEFNLREWVPPANVEVPALPPEAFVAWYELRQQAETALRDRQWSGVPPLARRMCLLDEGCSPVTGHLLGRALEALGDGAGAREAYEDSRDSVCGLLIRYTPRITRAAQELLTSFCELNGLHCVDLRKVLAADDLPEMPDPCHFLDFCHLSESGIDIAMSAVAEAIHQPRTANDGTGQRFPAKARTELNPRDRAGSHLIAACYNAHNRQPAPILRRHLRSALEIWPDSLELAKALLDVLEGFGPLWTNRQLSRLMTLPQLARYFEMLVARRAESLGLWTLRACLAEIIPDREPPPSASRTCSIELLEVPEGPSGAGHTAPNFTAGRSYIQATSHRTRLYFLQRSDHYSEIELTYRMATIESMEPAHADVNRVPIGALPFTREWSSVRLPINVKAPGICELEIQWPVGSVDYDGRRGADTIALSCGDYPYVLPVFGEISSARVFAPLCGGSGGGSPNGSRISGS